MNNLIYELATADGYTLGLFPSESAARHNASYLPNGRYQVNELVRIDEFLVFDPKTNNQFIIENI